MMCKWKLSYKTRETDFCCKVRCSISCEMPWIWGYWLTLTRSPLASFLSPLARLRIACFALSLPCFPFLRHFLPFKSFTTHILDRSHGLALHLQFTFTLFSVPGLSQLDHPLEIWYNVSPYNNCLSFFYSLFALFLSLLLAVSFHTFHA